jgi:hypothetical protein
MDQCTPAKRSSRIQLCFFVQRKITSENLGMADTGLEDQEGPVQSLVLVAKAITSI